MRKVVANTTPIIALADIGQLDLLRQLYGEIIIPTAVLDEIISEPARRKVGESDWIIVESVSNAEQKRLFKSRLHEGEVEVMLLAQEQHADLVIIDDNAAKKTAKFLGINVTGTMGILIRAKQNGLIDEVKPLIEELLDKGLYIGQEVVDMVLEAAGEK